MSTTKFIQRLLLVFVLAVAGIVTGSPGDAVAQFGDPEPTSYRSFDGTDYELFAYSGEHIALLVPDPDRDPATIEKIVAAIDAGYEYYQQVTGREPGLFRNYNGLGSVAIVDQSCGAGCAYLGVTGIEILTPYFDVLYGGVLNADEYDQVVFYELGRNFWFYGNELTYKTPDSGGSMTTGFAVFHRFMAMEAAGVEGGPFRGHPFSYFRDEVIGLLDRYLADESLTWENTLKIGTAPVNPLRLGGADLTASFMFELVERYGEEFLPAFYDEVGARPVASTTQDAVDNFVAAAALAAGENLADLFTDEWRWPLSPAAHDELADAFPTRCSSRALFVGGRSTALTGDASLLDAVAAAIGGADCVEVISDDDVTVAEAERFDVAVVSSSVSPSVLGDRFRDAAVPILVSEPFVFDDMSMVSARRGKELAAKDVMSITDPDHPLAAGLDGRIAVFDSPAKLNYGIEDGASAATAVARTHPTTARMTIFGFERGDALTDRVAPAARVGFFASFGATLSADGIALVGAAVDWLADDEVRCGDIITSDLTLTHDLVDCPASGLVVGADDITIDLNSFTLDGSEPGGFLGGAGIEVNGYDGVTIRNGTIRGFSFGVELNQADQAVVLRVVFADNVHSIEMVQANDNTIVNASSTRTDAAAMRLTLSDGNVIMESTVKNSNWGVLLDRSDANAIFNNVFDGGDTGRWQGVGLGEGSDGNIVHDNTITRFQDNGILAAPSTRASSIERNEVHNNSPDGIHTSEGSHATIASNVANDNHEWGIRALGDVADGGGNTATGNGLGGCIGVACRSATTPTGLLVAGNAPPPSGDRQMVELIEAAGIDLTIIDDDSDLSAVDLTPFDVIFISTSVVPGKVGERFRDVPVPVVTWEGYLFDDMKMADRSGETRKARTSIIVTDHRHPIAAGLRFGPNIVHQFPEPLSFGVGVPAQQVIAYENRTQTNAVVFAFETGDVMSEGVEAPAVRVGLFPTYGTKLTSAGQQLVRSTIEWVVAEM